MEKYIKLIEKVKKEFVSQYLLYIFFYQVFDKENSINIYIKIIF